MSARRQKRSRRYAKRARILKHREAQAARKDMRAANSEYEPVRNHKVRDLLVRVKDSVLGEGPSLWPVRRWDPATGTDFLIFVHGFRHWPSLAFDEAAPEVRIRDFVEAPKYSTVEI